MSHFEDKNEYFTLFQAFFRTPFYFTFKPLNIIVFRIFLKMLMFFVLQTVLLGNLKICVQQAKDNFTSNCMSKNSLSIFISNGILTTLLIFPLGRAGELAIFDFLLPALFPPAMINIL